MLLKKSGYSFKKEKRIHKYITNFPCTRQGYPYTHMQVEFTTWISNSLYNVNMIASAGDYLIFNQKTCSSVLKTPKRSVILER